jgi:transporter family-2 protein
LPRHHDREVPLPAATTLLALLGVLAGSLLTLQATINAQLGRALGHPLLAAAVSFSVGLAALLLAALAGGATLPGPAALRSVPLHVWLAGGLCGASYLSASIVIAPRLGAAALMSLVICSQLTAAILLDQLGLLGLPDRPVSFLRLAGVGFLLLGAFLVTRY